jgi:phosphoglycolate phosphatase
VGTLAVIFDLDGTLIDSLPDVRHALNRLLAAKGRRQLGRDEVATTIGHGARAMIAEAFALAGGPGPEPGHLPALVEEYLGYYKADPVRDTVLFPGALAVLQSLRADGVRLGICSNKPDVMVELVLDRLGIAHLFDGVTGGQSVPQPKPHASHLTETMRRMGAEGLPAVMVGDSDTDVAAARNAGLPVVAVEFGYARGPVAELGADAVISGFAELPSVIARLLRGEPA